jgi:hypothetical protein
MEPGTHTVAVLEDSAQDPEVLEDFPVAVVAASAAVVPAAPGNIFNKQLILNTHSLKNNYLGLRPI